MTPNNIQDIKISVLMSVFNETREEIIESITSVLNQSFRRFEFIIVNDNPGRVSTQVSYIRA